MPALPILLAIGGIAALCLMDALVKQISLSEAVVTAAWLRYLFGTLTTIPLVIMLRRRLPPRARWPRHLFRGAIMAVMGYLFFFAISALPLAETLAITFIAPLLVPPLGALFLGERIRLGAALAGLVGFVGVLVTLNGGDMTTPQASELRLLGIGAALVSALLYAVQSILLREMAQRDDPLTVTMLSTAIPFVCVMPFALAFAPLPAPASLPLGLAAGAAGTCGFLLLTLAYARAEAQLLIIFEYTGLFWAALLGWALFDEVPRLQIFMGAGIIIGACLFASLHERRAAQILQKKSAA